MPLPQQEVIKHLNDNKCQKFIKLNFQIRRFRQMGMEKKIFFFSFLGKRITLKYIGLRTFLMKILKALKLKSLLNLTYHAF